MGSGARPDVIVVGAGSAGSVLTRRLLDAGRSVLLLEAGPTDTHPAIPELARLGELWRSEVDWNYSTVPQPGAAGRRLFLPRGRVVGGSHALNACIWVRGCREDYDDWARAGNDGWGWDDVLPVFRDIENFQHGASDVHGADGLLDVVADYPLNPLQQAVLEAVQQAGVERVADYNAGRLDGVAPEQVTVRDGRRFNTWHAYLRPVLDHPGLEVVTGAWVHDLLVEGGAVRGVRYALADGPVQEVRADTVVLSAGALDTPRVLLRSGIGPAAELAALGIDPVHDLPGVGRNLHDHLLVPVIVGTEREIPLPGPGQSATQVHWWWRSRPGLDRPDTQPLVFSVPMYGDTLSGPPGAFTIYAALVTPKSRGTLTLTGPDPADPTAVDLGALTHPDDVASLLASVRQARDVVRQPALAGWGPTELHPAPDLDGAGLEEYVRQNVCTYHHQVGTARMGTDEQAVVDPRTLAVHGVAGLHVADASVIPTIPAGNTNAPSILIGEKAARALVAATTGAVAAAV